LPHHSYEHAPSKCKKTKDHLFRSPFNRYSASHSSTINVAAPLRKLYAAACDGLALELMTFAVASTLLLRPQSRLFAAMHASSNEACERALAVTPGNEAIHEAQKRFEMALRAQQAEETRRAEAETRRAEAETRRRSEAARKTDLPQGTMPATDTELAGPKRNSAGDRKLSCLVRSEELSVRNQSVASSPSRLLA